MKSRKVDIYRFVKKEDNQYHKEWYCQAIFHQFGCDYEEFESGPGNYSTAIVELEDGTVENVPVEMIKFVKNDQN